MKVFLLILLMNSPLAEAKIKFYPSIIKNRSKISKTENSSSYKKINCSQNDKKDFSKDYNLFIKESFLLSSSLNEMIEEQEKAIKINEDFLSNYYKYSDNQDSFFSKSANYLISLKLKEIEFMSRYTQSYEIKQKIDFSNSRCQDLCISNKELSKEILPLLTIVERKLNYYRMKKEYYNNLNPLGPLTSVATQMKNSIKQYDKTVNEREKLKKLQKFIKKMYKNKGSKYCNIK